MQFIRSLARPFPFISAAAGLALAAGTTSAQTIQWNNPNGGLASTPANWSPAGTPGSSINLIFNVNSALPTIPITFDAASSSALAHTYRSESYTHTMASTHTSFGNIFIGDQTGDNAAVTLASGTWTLGNVNNQVRLANSSGTTGALSIVGSTSTFNAASSTSVGLGGAGTLSILNGGKYAVAAGGSVTLAGTSPASSGALTVSGQLAAPPFTRSTLSGGNTLAAIGNGSGTINVTDGALVDTVVVSLGGGGASSNTVTVSGAVHDPATLKASGFTSSGSSGTQIVNINGGGLLDVANSLSIGGGIGSGPSTLHVDASGQVKCKNLSVNATGVLDLTGGNISVSNGTFSYSNPTSHLTLGGADNPVVELTNGTQSTLGIVTSGLSLSVGDASSGDGIAQFFIQSGSDLTLSAGGASLGVDPIDDGTLAISDLGSTFTMPVSETITVGQAGAGALLFQNGAQGTLGNVQTSQGATAAGTMTIAGAGTSVIATTLSVAGTQAASGGDSVALVSGGALLTINSGVGIDAVNIWPNGELDIMGPGSKVATNNRVDMTAGGSLYLFDGGVLQCPNLAMGGASTLHVRLDAGAGAVPANIDAQQATISNAALNVSFLPGSSVNGTSEFVILSAPGGISGQFGAITLPAPGPYGSLRVVQTPTQVKLQLCYANCDGSTGTPGLTAADFACFLTKFRTADPYANCDGSTGTPSLTAADFACFLGRFRVGCP